MTDEARGASGRQREDAATCVACRARCCRLEVMLTSDDDIPLRLVEEDRWGGHVMARREDGWCAALDRATMLCSIYERRPGICREYELNGSDCVAERATPPAVVVWHARP